MCQYCSMDLRNAGPRDLTLDHYIPAQDGGCNGSGNLLTACDTCNSRKRDMSAGQYFLLLGQRRGHGGADLLRYIEGATARAEYQMAKPLNRRLARALLDGRAPTLFDSVE